MESLSNEQTTYPANRPNRNWVSVCGRSDNTIFVELTEMKCAWCDRDGGKLHPLMSRDYLCCDICAIVWYDQTPETPEQLRKLSLEFNDLNAAIANKGLQ